MPHIVSAAIRYSPPTMPADNPWPHPPLIVSVPAPGRHGTILPTLYQLNTAAALEGEQGFLTDEGQFLDRVEAKRLVAVNGQKTIRNTHPRELYSEDIW